MTPPEDVQVAEREMRRGLRALLLEAPAVVVEDVETRVNGYVDALASRLAAETARADAAEADALQLCDQHISDEVRKETQQRIIKRAARCTCPDPPELDPRCPVHGYRGESGI